MASTSFQVPLPWGKSSTTTHQASPASSLSVDDDDESLPSPTPTPRGAPPLGTTVVGSTPLNGFDTAAAATSNGTFSFTTPQRKQSSTVSSRRRLRIKRLQRKTPAPAQAPTQAPAPAPVPAAAANDKFGDWLQSHLAAASSPPQAPAPAPAATDSGIFPPNFAKSPVSSPIDTAAAAASSRAAAKAAASDSRGERPSPPSPQAPTSSSRSPTRNPFLDSSFEQVPGAGAAGSAEDADVGQVPAAATQLFQAVGRGNKPRKSPPKAGRSRRAGRGKPHRSVGGTVPTPDVVMSTSPAPADDSVAPPPSSSSARPRQPPARTPHHPQVAASLFGTSTSSAPAPPLDSAGTFASAFPTATFAKPSKKSTRRRRKAGAATSTTTTTTTAADVTAPVTSIENPFKVQSPAPPHDANTRPATAAPPARPVQPPPPPTPAAPQAKARSSSPVRSPFKSTTTTATSDAAAQFSVKLPFGPPPPPQLQAEQAEQEGVFTVGNSFRPAQRTTGRRTSGRHVRKAASKPAAASLSAPAFDMSAVKAAMAEVAASAAVGSAGGAGGGAGAGAGLVSGGAGFMVDAERAAQSAAAQATAEFMSVESEGVPQPQDEEAAQSTPTAGRRRTVRVRRSSPAVRAAALAKHQETLKVNNLLSQAAKSVTQGLFAAAIGKYGAVLEMRPADSTTRGLRAAAYLHVDNYRAALADAKVVISTDSRNSKARVVAARACLELGDLVAATDHFRTASVLGSAEGTEKFRALRKYPRYLTDGLEAMRQKQYKKAIMRASACVRQCPWWVPAVKLKLELMWVEGNYKAVRDLGRSILPRTLAGTMDQEREYTGEFQSTYEAVALLVGRALWYMLDSDGASTILEAVQRASESRAVRASAVALLRQQRRVQTLKSRGNASYGKHRYTEANAAYAAAIEECDRTPVGSRLKRKNELWLSMLHANRAACFMQLKQYAQAHEECDIALKLNVGNVKARIRRARALVVLALFGDAIQDYDAVLHDRDGVAATNIPFADLKREREDAVRKRSAARRAAAEEQTRQRREREARQRRQYQQKQEARRERDRSRRSSRSSSSQHGYSRGHGRSGGAAGSGGSGGSYKAASEAAPKKAQETLYQVLGVDQKATATQIKKAYHKLALKYHPDKLKAGDAATVKASTERFKAIGEAYSLLSEPSQRREYDSKLARQSRRSAASRSRRYGGGGGGGFNQQHYAYGFGFGYTYGYDEEEY